MSSVPVRLSIAKPDFESIVLQLQLYLSTKSAWVDQQTSSTGQSIIEAVAAVGAFNQFALETNFREAFPYTALRDSSIYAISDMLGVHIVRKTPARTVVTFTRTKNLSMPLVVPRLSIFTISSKTYFNRDPIVFSPGANVADAPVTVYAGVLKTQTFQGKSVGFQEILLNEPGFNVSDEDVYVYVINPSTLDRQLWYPTEDGLWIAASTDQVYYDRTDGDGDVLLTFGDSVHGASPSLGYNIEVIYAVTDGSAGNNGSSGLQCIYSVDNDIKGPTSTSIIAGADEKPASFYKILAPHIYKSRKRAVTSSDYKAITVSYPGVASAVIKTQKDIAPNDIRWMNTIRICILPFASDSFTDLEWTDFLAFMEDKKHAAVDIQKFNPVKKITTVRVVVALFPNAIPGEVYPKVQSGIQKLFAKDLTTLGRRIAISDIIEASRTDDVDYVQVLEPTADLFATVDQDPTAPYSWYFLQNLEINVTYSERRFYNDRPI